MGTISRAHAIPTAAAGPGTTLHRFIGSPVSLASATPTTPTSPTGTPATGATTPGTSGNAAAAAAPTPTISEADFMQLLVTQLQNQDPMNPLQPYELAAQLAQFTSVQQLAQLNSQFTTQASAVNSNTQAVEANMATSLIGRPIVATGNAVDVSAKGNNSVIADVGGSGGQAQLTLTNAQGQTVATYNLGAVGGGRQSLSFASGGVAPGPYNYSLSVTDSSGNAVPVSTYVAGTVTSVDVSTATPTLDIGDLSVPINNLVEVLPPGANPSSPSQEIVKQ